MCIIFFEGFYIKHNPKEFFTIKEDNAHSQCVLIVKFHFKIHSGNCTAFDSIIKAEIIVDSTVPNFSSQEPTHG